MEQILPAACTKSVFAAPGHPVVIDGEHGDFAFKKKFRKAYGLKRQFLHAATIGFE